jgi:hypothetical protein
MPPATMPKTKKRMAGSSRFCIGFYRLRAALGRAEDLQFKEQSKLRHKLWHEKLVKETTGLWRLVRIHQRQDWHFIYVKNGL